MSGKTVFRNSEQQISRHPCKSLQTTLPVTIKTMGITWVCRKHNEHVECDWAYGNFAKENSLNTLHTKQIISLS